MSAGPADGGDGMAAAPRGVGGLLRFGAKVVAFVALVAFSVLGLLVFVPDGNDYALASRLKHQRLAEAGSPKVVLVGGSNLAFGMDSAKVGAALGCPVVNMGMNGYLGIRFMLEEVRPHLRADDTVVLAFEWDSFYKSVEGDPTALLAILKANPSTASALTLDQQVDILRGAPEAAQQKAQRLVKDALTAVGLRRGGSEFDRKMKILDEIESLRGFTAEGDLVSHLDHPPLPFAMGLESFAPGAPVEYAAVDLIRAFAVQMQEKGVRVLVSYTPTPRDFHERHKADLAAIHGMLAAAPAIAAPRAPAGFTFDDSQFFDTVYHLNAEGRPLRTQRVIDDLNALKACAPRAPHGENRDEPRPST